MNSGFTSLGLKSQILPVGLSEASTIFSYSDAPGILRRLWIAVNGTVTNGKAVPGNVFLRIYVDGTIRVGNYAIDREGIGYCEEANSNSNHAIHNNQTNQNQLSIINTQTNENEKTPTPKTKATHKKRGEKKEERESLRDRLRKGYEKIVGSGEDKLQSFRDIREGIWGREFYY